MVEVYLQYPDYSTRTGSAVESLGMCATNREVRELINKDAKNFWGDVVVNQGNGNYTLCVNTTQGPKPIKDWFYFTRSIDNG